MWGAAQVLDVLREQAVPLVVIDGFAHRGKLGLAPEGTLNHHTAAVSRTAVPSLSVVINGRSDLPGPLCNFLLGRDARCYCIALGKANHAGNGSRAVLDAVRRGVPVPARPGPDEVSGNYRLWGIEVENDGVGEPYSPAVLDVLVRINAGLARLARWNEWHSIHHREWTRRKIDMSYLGSLRPAIAQRILVPNKEPTLPEYDPGQPAVVVYDGSPEEHFIRDYLKGATRLYSGQLLANFQIIAIPRDHSWLPNPMPPVTVGLGTHVTGWGQIAGADRYETLKKIIAFLGVPAC